MADETGQRRTAKRPSIGPKPVRVLTVPIRAADENVEGLFDSGDAPHPRMVDQLTDLAREAWLNLHLNGSGESGRFEFLVVPPKPATKFPSRMWSPFAGHARRSIERVLAGASPHETLPVPHAFNDWIIKFERINNDGMSAKQALNQLRNALDKVKAQAQGDADLRRESAELLEGALGELRMPPVEGLAPTREAAPVDAGELNVPVGDPRQPMLSAEETIERLRGLRDREAIQAFLERFVVRRSWNTLEENQLFVNELNDHLRLLKLRVACVRDGNPSLLRCYPTTNARNGAFYFDHSKNRHGGSTTMPDQMKVVEETPDPRRKITKMPTARS